MAGMFYSLKEAAEKLNVAEEQITELVEQGKLREFRDGANLLFKVDEIEALTGDTSITAAQPETDGQQEVSLEPVEDAAEQEPVAEEELVPIAEDTDVQESNSEEEPLAEDTTVQETAEPEAPAAEAAEDELTLSDKPDEGSSLGVGLTNADTAITREGINVLDGTEDGYNLAEDTMSETQAMETAGSLEEIEEDVNLDTFGSGSGLLDLSLQADDTSLGGILDEIYTPEQEQGAAPAAAESASAEDVAAEANMLADEGLATPQLAAIVQGYIEPEPDSSSNLFGIMLFLPLLVVIYTAIVAAAGLFHVMPTVLEQTRGFIVYILGGLVIVALILAVMGAMAGQPATGSKPKAKKEKRPKAKTKAKAKKEKPKK